MAVTNAFIGKTEQPSPEELTAVLGPSEKLWEELIEWMATELGATNQEWKGVVPKKYGWSLRLKIKAEKHSLPGPVDGVLFGCVRSGRPGSEGGERGALPGCGDSGDCRRPPVSRGHWPAPFRQNGEGSAGHPQAGRDQGGELTGDPPDPFLHAVHIISPLSLFGWRCGFSAGRVSGFLCRIPGKRCRLPSTVLGKIRWSGRRNRAVQRTRQVLDAIQSAGA